MPKPFGPLTRRMLGEEKLGALHWLVAIACFEFVGDWAGWIFVVRALCDEWLALKFAWLANRQEPDE